MKVRDKNPLLAGLIRELEERGRREKVPFWGALAKKLNRPRRIGYEVNLFGLERNAEAGKTVVVPGTVLGTGSITKPVNVAALRFSRLAREKIAKAGGKCMSMEDFASATKSVKGVRIMG
jgi:large subunit ribosomal protein L18e